LEGIESFVLSGVSAKMFEIGIISIVVLAIGYWVTLWLMARHNDVLHGDFVHADDGMEAAERPDPLLAGRPPFPPKPVMRRSAVPPVAANAAGARPAAVRPAPAGTPSTHSSPASSAPSSPRANRTDTLQALLASIKRDLKDASQL
jgi:hypothetical protein